MAGRLIDNFSMRRPRALADLGTGRSRFLRSWGLQPRIAPVCTGAGTGSSSTRFRRRFRRFPRRSGIFCRDRSGSTGFRALVQSQVRFNGSRRRLLRRSQRRIWESLVQGQISSTGFRGRFRRRSGRLWCRARSRATGFRRRFLFGAGPCQVPTGSKGFQRLVSQHASERFVKIKRCGCWGYHRSLFS